MPSNCIYDNLNNIWVRVNELPTWSLLVHFFPSSLLLIVYKWHRAQRLHRNNPTPEQYLWIRISWIFFCPMPPCNLSFPPFLGKPLRMQPTPWTLSLLKNVSQTSSIPLTVWAISWQILAAMQNYDLSWMMTKPMSCFGTKKLQGIFKVIFLADSVILW